MIDEVTRTFPAGAVRVRSETAELAARVASTELVGLVGVPARALSELAAQAYPLQFTVDADGYVPHPVRATIPAHPAQGAVPAFPERFDPLSLNPIELHRLPTAIRAFAFDSSHAALANIAVTMPSLRRSLTSPDVPARIAAIQPPLHAARDTAASTVQACAINPVAGSGRALSAPIPAGALSLHLDDVAGIAPGLVLQIDAANPERSEYATVASVAAGASGGEVKVSHPLHWLHARGATVRRVTVQLQQQPTSLADRAIRGDGCIFVNNLGPLQAAVAVSISGGGDPVAEIHRVRLFATSTDANGAFTLPPISRVGRVTLRFATANGPEDAQVIPDYHAPETHLDIVV